MMEILNPAVGDDAQCDTLRPLGDLDPDTTDPLCYDGGDLKLTGSKCRACGDTAFPKRTFCMKCGARDMACYNLPSKGKLFTRSTIHISARFETPYTVSYVDMDDGTRVFARLAGGAEAAPLDSDVVLAQTSDGWAFVPCEEE